MNKYGTEKIVTRSEGYTTIGDKYNRPGHGNRHWLWWNDNWRVGIPITETYTYENRLQAATSTFHWRDISDKEKLKYNLFDYPAVRNLTVPVILTQGPNFIAADQYLRYENGWLNTTMGGHKKVRIWILVFVDQPESAGEAQEMYWKNGNKNEFIVMFGINKEGEITWQRITSWTKKETLKIEVRDEIMLSMIQGKDGYTGKLDQESMTKFSKFLADKIRHGYVKPNFREYNYLSVAPTLPAVIITYIIVLLVCVGMAIFVVKNEWQTRCVNFNDTYRTEYDKDTATYHRRRLGPVIRRRP